MAGARRSMATSPALRFSTLPDVRRTSLARGRVRCPARSWMRECSGHSHKSRCARSRPPIGLEQAFAITGGRVGGPGQALSGWVDNEGQPVCSE